LYSPRISEDLIPELYRISKKEKVPMAKLVDRFLREKIEEYKMREYL